MSFLAPYMLWGALAAAIPIVLHFFYRSRYRTVPWAAMKFLLAAIEQTSRRLRFQELLLLLLRVALLVLLALAFARPSTSNLGGSGQGDAVDAVFIIDNSMSMSARSGVAPPGLSNDPYLSALRQLAGADGSLTCFDRARASALAVLASLPPQSTVQVIGCADRASLLGPRTPSHLDQARQVIEEMTLTKLGTDYLPGVTLAADLLLQGPSPNKELYLFSDMQQSGWTARSSALVDKLDEVHKNANVHLVHCLPRNPSNVSLVGITAQSTLRSGERADFAVLLRNTGKVTARNLTVTLEIDGNPAMREAQPVASLEPGATRAVVLSGILDRPGRHILTATVKPDDLEGDNRLDQIITVPDQVGVLVVDGTPNLSDPSRSASYYLSHALNPLSPGFTSGLPVTVVSPERASPRDLGGKELCILVNARLETDQATDQPRVGDPGAAVSTDFLRAMSAFVQEGKSVMIFAGDRVDPALYNRLLFEQQRLLPYRLTKLSTAVKDRPWTIDRTSAEEQTFGRFRTEQGYAGIDRIKVWSALGLDTATKDVNLAEESRVLLRYSNGTPAVASRRRPGQGEVMLWTTSVSDPPGWSSLQASIAFVPMVQVAVNHLLAGQPQTLNKTAGEPVVWIPARQASELAHDLVNPEGQRTRLGYPTAIKGRAVLTITDLSRAGLYRVLPAGRDVAEDSPVIAITPDIRETDNLEGQTPAQIDERLGFVAIHTTAADDGSVFSGAERLRREWTLWLLALLLLLVLGEMLLAWFCGRAPTRGPESIQWSQGGTS